MRVSLIYPAIIFSSLLTLSACDVSKSLEEHQLDAKQSMADNDYKTAIISLKNALQNKPDDTESRYLLGKSYLLNGEINGAKKELNRALELGFDLNLIQPLLVRCDLFVGDSNGLVDQNKQQVSLAKATQIEVNAISGIGLSYLGMPQQGQALLAESLQSDLVDNFYYKLAKVWVAGNNDQVEQAIAMAKTLMAEDSEFKDAQLLLANLYIVNNQHDMAIDLLENYIENFQYNYLVRLTYISTLLQVNRIVDAEKQTDFLLSMFPNAWFANELKAEISLRQGQYKEAAEYAGIALTNQPGLFKSNLIAGLGFYQSGNDEMAFHHLALIESRLPPSHFAHQILTTVKLRLGYTEEAIAVIDAIEDLTEDEFSLLANASVALIRTGDREKAQEYIKRMDSIESTDSRLLSKRGVFKLSVNDAGGIKDLEQAISLDPDYDNARLALLYNYLRNAKYAEAMKVANVWINEFPKKDGGYLAQGLVWRKQGNTVEAKKSFKMALQQVPDSLGGLYNLAALDVNNKQYQSAFNYLKQLLELNPTHEGGLRLVVNISDKLDDELQAIKVIDSLIINNPEQVSLQLSKAKILVKNGKAEQAMELLAKLESSQYQNQTYLTLYGTLALANSQFELSERIFKQLTTIAPNLFSAHVGLLSVYEAQGNFQQAFTQVKKSQTIFPARAELRLYEVHYLLKTKSFAQAKLTLDKIDETKVNPSKYLALKTKYHGQVGELDASLKYARQLYSLNPDYNNSLLFAQVLQKSGNRVEALTIVEKSINEFGITPSLENLRAELNVDNNPEQSLAYYQKLAKDNPNNYVVLNNLAWSALLVNDYQLGLESAQKAVALAPDQPQVLDTLAVAQMKLGNYEEAESILVKVLEKLPNEVSVSLHYAEALIHLSKLSQAQAVLDNLENSSEKQELINLIASSKG
ncbi:XrtA/PEP-CTERM system TPR-repeat protein PrsT [Thalassomonas sp. M1454]|uniref:XrtA/PEP-CTERM system TPR-repeat protein PrsT n=1 Tax=Thalassomonas sp. M1454 TaxID=2594477 RepID=UPI00163D5D17|nr:XrtA/PEP-CTERM system TPR-repeat protein PrsT [Thalassomonas sp. M1454]